MKITFDEILNRKEWLHRELLNSLTPELVIKAESDRFYDVKLLVNGVQVEPEIFNIMMNNIEKVIDDEAASLVRAEIEELEGLHQKIDEMIEAVKGKYEQYYT